MKTKYNQIISYILAVFMLLSGMCLENAEADSLFVSYETAQMASTIGSLEKEILCNESCTIEMLGIRSTSYALNAVRRSNYRMDVRYRAAIALFCVEKFAQNLSNFHIAVNAIQFPELYGKAVVLHYIHSQDGKK